MERRDVGDEEWLNKAIKEFTRHLGSAIRAGDLAETARGTKDAMSMAESAKSAFEQALLARLTEARLDELDTIKPRFRMGRAGEKQDPYAEKVIDERKAELTALAEKEG